MTIETLTALIRERRDQHAHELALMGISGLGLPTARTQQHIDRLRGAIAELEHLLRCAETPTVTIEVETLGFPPAVTVQQVLEVDIAARAEEAEIDLHASWQEALDR